MATILGISLLATANRHSNEKRRRLGLKGNDIEKFDDKNVVECSKVINLESNKLIILENGLGLPLESWDYIKLFLGKDYNILLHNRNGYGFTNFNKDEHFLLENIIKNNFKEIEEIIFITHSIGSLAASNFIVENEYIARYTKKIIFIDGTEPSLFTRYRDDNFQRGEFIQASGQKIFAGIFGFQWWGIDKYARRSSYRPDIQESVRLFESNPKSIISSYREYTSINVNNMLYILKNKNIDKYIISSSERKFQQMKLSEEYSLPISVIEDSLHYSIISSPETSLEVSNIIKNFIDKND